RIFSLALGLLVAGNVFFFNMFDSISMIAVGSLPVTFRLAIGLAAIATFFASAAAYMLAPRDNVSDDERALLSTAHVLVGLALIWLLPLLEANAQLLAVIWALEGFALIIAGLLLRNTLIGWFGLGVFGILFFKVMLFDLSGSAP